MIFKTERDSFRVLDQNGQVRLVKPHQISMRRDTHRAIATDGEGHELRINDNVKEIDGEVHNFGFVRGIWLTTLIGSERTCFAYAPVVLCLLVQQGLY